MTDEKCETCRFWKASVEVKETGFCRRNPPTLSETILRHLIDEDDGDGDVVCVMNAQGHHYFASLFPGTSEEEWCGEWQIRPDLLDCRPGGIIFKPDTEPAKEKHTHGPMGFPGPMPRIDAEVGKATLADIIARGPEKP